MGFVAIVATGCVEPDESAPRVNSYDVTRIELADRGDALYHGIDFDGTGIRYNALWAVLANYTSLVAPALPSIDEILLRDDDGIGRKVLWRMHVFTGRASDAPEMLDVLTHVSGMGMLDGHTIGTFEAPTGPGSAIVARGGRAIVPLGRLFDATATVEPGWYEADVAVSLGYPGPTRGTIVGVLGFVIDPDAMRTVVVPSLTRGLAQVVTPDASTFPAIDIDDDGAITEADVAYWVGALAEPDVDADGDGVEESHTFTLGFGALRGCGTDEYGCTL